MEDGLNCLRSYFIFLDNVQISNYFLNLSLDNGKLRNIHPYFPLDLLHDMFEGVVAEDLLSIIRTLSSKGWFSIDAYNCALKDFKWFSYETSDIPQSVSTSRKSKKLKGKAVSQVGKPS